ncbi:amidohydrolase [Nonomuraea turkmeniaca]|uniref:Amidohydrolase n=1 Tax=Nonomuraea turkmeniaca TaxID=103838 RepID=A0A5S4EUY9_9ACTN|nr:amidohydrolase family protein [Nonomuraea turkmeniaca]TMR06719.1 amidohydrolase [Nonomuraea turkmeniaca]
MLIDVHGHLAPPGERAGGPPGLHDPEAMIEAKLALGVEMTIIGSPVGAGSMLPGTGAANYQQDAATVRAHNEALAELARRHPAHLRCYAYLDPFAGEAMLGQAAELLAEPEFVGLIVNTSVEGRFLSSPRADDFFAFAAEAGVPVLLHPPAEPVGTDAVLDLGPGVVEHLARLNDVTMGVAALVCAGRLERHPGLQLIAPGGGGALGMLAEKLDLAMAPRPGREEQAPRWLPSRSLRRVLVDTSCPNRAQLRANLDFFGADQVLFGTDAPPLMGELERMVGLVSDLEAGALAANAERVFGLGVRA